MSHLHPQRRSDAAAGDSVPRELPDGCIHAFEQLANAGQRAWLVGEGPHALLAGKRPRGWEAIVAAGPNEVLALFPRAVATRPADRIVTLPTAGGPIDLHCREDAPDHRPAPAELARRGVSVLALALDPLAGEWIDPDSGIGDAAARRLRLLGKPRSWLPGVGVRAARLIAEHGYRPEPSVAELLSRTRSGLLPFTAADLRGELRRILLGPHVRSALEFLRESGIEARLVKGVRPDAARVVEALPPQLPIRLTAWLRDARSRAFLRQLGFGVQFSGEIYRRLEHHPIDRVVSARRPVAVGRLLKRFEPDELELMLLLREAEIGAAEKSPDPELTTIEIEQERAGVARLRAALEHARQRAARERGRPELVLGGSDVMQALGCSPGPEIGRALAHLASIVDRDPDANTREKLFAHLEAWREDACRPS